MSAIQQHAGAHLTPASSTRDPSWKSVMGAGALVAGAGIVAIAVPAVASVSVAILIGCLLIVAGVAYGLGALHAAGGGRKVLFLAAALLFVVAGVNLLADPLTGTVTIAFILSLLLIINGVAHLVWAARAYRAGDRIGLAALNGVLGVVLGVMIANHLPSSASWAIGLLVGINLLCCGAVLTGWAMSLRRAAEV